MAVAPDRPARMLLRDAATRAGLALGSPPGSTQRDAMPGSPTGPPLALARRSPPVAADRRRPPNPRPQTEVGVECMMHLTCTNMEKEKVVQALERCKEVGIRNILALRGDPPKGQERWEAVEGGFQCALDLVRYIRQEFGDYFGIGVAGYPEAHPDVIVEDPKEMEENYWKDIRYLKEKIDAGADFVVTQVSCGTRNWGGPITALCPFFSLIAWRPVRWCASCLQKLSDATRP